MTDEKEKNLTQDEKKVEQKQTEEAKPKETEAAKTKSAEVEDEDDFGKLLEEYDHKQPREGEMVKGRVIAVGKEYVTVDIGFKSEGPIPISEFKNPLTGEVEVKEGDEIDVVIESIEDDEGVLRLSKEKADRLKIWDEIEDIIEKEGIVEGTIIDRVKGGLSVNVKGIKAFLPGSQIDLRPVRNLDKLIGQTYKFKVIKHNRKRGNLVLSRRALLEEERASMRAKTIEMLQEGATVKGTVKNITNYGAFIDLGGIDGLLHITDMSWGRINHPSEMLQIGEELEVLVLKYDMENERVSLGLKQLKPDPWQKVAEKYPIGEKVVGKVVSMADYGAFVELEDGIEGLIHVSEMSWTRRIKHPSQVVSIGDEVEVVVLAIDEENRRISLGLKQTQPNPWLELQEKYPPGTIIQGKVRNVTDFGVFIGIEEGIDGLVHVSDISWTEKIKHPADKFKKGQEVKAVVLSVDPENERIALSIKQLTPDPWETIEEKYSPGTVISGKVTKVTDFGAFVELEPEIEGLVHISELSTERVEDPHKVVKVGDEVKAVVQSVDKEDRRIGLSMKALLTSEDKQRIAEYLDKKAEDKPGATLGDLLKDKLGVGTEEKTEEEKQAEETTEESSAE